MYRIYIIYAGGGIRQAKKLHHFETPAQTNLSVIFMDHAFIHISEPNADNFFPLYTVRAHFERRRNMLT